MFHLILSFNLLFSSPTETEQDYLIYHQRINEVENLIVQKEYLPALDELEQVFDTYEFIFLRDYKIATQLALMVGNEKKAFYYLRLGITHGWRLKDIKKNNFLKPILKSDEWKIIKSQYDSIRTRYKNRINELLRNQVHQMYKRDQKKALVALLRIGNKAQEKYGEKKFAPHSRLQLAELDDILSKHGYPGEKVIGNDWWVSLIVSHHNSSAYESVRNDTIFQYMKPKFLTAIKNGEMSPYEFALMQDWKTAVENGHQKSSYGFLGAIKSQVSLKEVDRNRRNIGMRSISNRNALVDIEKETGMNFYLPGKPWQDGKITVVSNR